MTGRTWDQQADEPDYWYRRFREWLSQGLPRSILRAYRADRARRGGRHDGVRCLAGSWHRAVKRYSWRARAHAFDQQQFRLMNAEFERFQTQRRQEYIVRVLHR